MTVFRCDFLINADLVLPEDTPNVVGTLSGHEISLKNAAPDANGHVVSLVATVIGASAAIGQAKDDFRDCLAEYLHWLAFVTQSRYEIVKPIQLIEWEPHQKTRTSHVYEVLDARYPADPTLNQTFLDTITALQAANPPTFITRALKYLRSGLIDSQPEDQFLQLWLALEIVAENIKRNERVPILCSQCGSNMKCATCGDEPMRVPMAKAAIEDTITQLTGPAAPRISKRQFKARNGLMHGRSTRSIAEECKMPFERLVEELGHLTWHAISNALPQADGELRFGLRDATIIKMVQEAIAIISFDHDGDSAHPEESQIPKPTLKLDIKFVDTPKAKTVGPNG